MPELARWAGILLFGIKEPEVLIHTVKDFVALFSYQAFVILKQAIKYLYVTQQLPWLLLTSQHPFIVGLTVP